MTSGHDKQSGELLRGPQDKPLARHAMGSIAILKPDDPVWKELIADIGSATSLTYVEDPAAHSRPFYVPSEEEPGFAFASLNREDRMDVLAETVSWRDYESRGIGLEQYRVVMANVLDGKPQEKWLEGAFDEAVLENDKAASFKTMVDMMKYSPDGHVFEEMDGDRLPWKELSDAAKLQYIARDAVFSGVRFEAFAQVVKDTIGDVGEAALRVVLDGQKELHAIAELLPDDGRTEPTPLVEQIKDVLDYVSALEAREEERLQGQEKLLEGAGRADRPAAAPEQGKLSLQDLRDASQDQEKHGEDQREKPREMER